MATYKRFNDNDEIFQGVDKTNINLGDILPIQHTTGDGDDKKISVGNLMTIPVLRVGSWSAGGAASATCLNFPSFNVSLGQCVSLTFSAAYTNANNQPAVTIGDRTLPIKVHGVAAGANFCKENSSFEGIVKTSATAAGTASGQALDPSTWFLDLDSNVKSADYTKGAESLTLSEGITVGAGGSGGGMNAWIGSQSDYEAIANPDENTIYFIEE